MFYAHDIYHVVQMLDGILDGSFSVLAQESAIHTYLCRLKKAGKKAVMLGIENGYAIGKDITNVQFLATISSISFRMRSALAVAADKASSVRSNCFR